MDTNSSTLERKKHRSIFLLVQVFGLVVLCTFFNIKSYQIFSKFTNESQSQASHCVNLGHQPWFHPFLASDRPVQGLPESVWRTITGSSIYYFPGPVAPVSSLNRTRLLRVQHTTEAALALAQADVPGAEGATITAVYSRKFDEGEHFSVLARVQGQNATEALRVVTASFSDDGDECTTSLTRPAARSRVNIVVPYSAREGPLRRFLSHVADALSADGGLSLRIGARGEDEIVAERLIREAGVEKHAVVVTVNSDHEGKFSRAVARRDATLGVPPNELVFFIDVDLAVSTSAFLSCRANTVQGSQVWFPVMFYAYPSKGSVARGSGFWLRYGYGIACFFRSDFEAVGGFGEGLEERYSGWGAEDKEFFFVFRDDPRYAVFRSFEPDLFHVWHEKFCERNSHYDDCVRIARMANRTLEQ